MSTKKEYPALFTAPMVRAIGTGQKTQTRRIVKPQPVGDPWFWEGDEKDPIPQWFDGFERGRDSVGAPIEEVNKPMRSPYGQPGDRIWVRENIRAEVVNGVRGVRYLADNAFGKCGTDAQWEKLAAYRGGRLQAVPSIHMPRWAARYVSDVTEVRVERLQDISEEDARAEGVEEWAKSEDGFAALRGLGFAISTAPRFLFQRLWTSIYGAESWDANPWVWVTSFKLVTP